MFICGVCDGVDSTFYPAQSQTSLSEFLLFEFYIFVDKRSDKVLDPLSSIDLKHQ